jgi:alcohol dehydrogenase (cytochrome c)
VDGIMYVTAVNEVYALDAGSGRQIWHFQRTRTPGAAAWANRGVAVAGDRVFFETDDARVLALNRWTGALAWDAPLAAVKDNYFATSAPLLAGNLVVSGVGGGEHGANGFIAAHDQDTGKEVWRFWTVPRPGEPGFETWKGSSQPDHRGAATWFTGSYDPDLDLVYWPVGNPSQEYNGDDREGDNLYANSIVALERKTGRLRWYYQFTPHDLWDWDATQTSVLVDADWQGRPRKLLLHASRNGFFYVFDRADGTLCSRSRSCATSRGRPASTRRAGRSARTGRNHRRRERRFARRRTARRTGSRRRTTPRPASTICRRSRSAASIRSRTARRGSRASSISEDRSGPRRIPCRCAC